MITIFNFNYEFMEKTLVIVKPDGVQRGLVGEVLARFERVGLKIVAMKMTWPDAKQVEKHYTTDPEWMRKAGEKTIATQKGRGITPMFEDPVEYGKFILGKLIKYISVGPVVAFILEGNCAVDIVRKIAGNTEPYSAPAGTIRGDYCIETYKLADTAERAVRNIVHASGSPEEAEKEIPVWFDKKEIIEYNRAMDRVLYDTDWDFVK